MKHAILLVPLGIVFALTACAMAPPAIPDRASLRPPVVEFGPASPEADAPPTAAMTLDEAVEAALLENPTLRAEFAKFEAMALRVPQATSLPDPRVTYTQFVDGVQTRTGEQEFAAGVSQMFPWFGELRLQGRIANSEALQSLAGYRTGMLDVKRDVTVAWHRLAYEQAAETLAREEKLVLEQSIAAAAAVYGSGRGSRSALLNAQTELVRIENELLGYPARIEELREDLRRLLRSGFDVAVPPLDADDVSESAIPGAKASAERALALRPELEGLRLRESQARLEHELARKDDYPDITLGLNYVGIGDRPDNPAGPMAPRDEGDDAWGATVGFNIPLPNARRRAAKQQALKEREAAEWRRIAAEEEIGAVVRSLLPKLMALEGRQEILRGSLLPLAEEARAVAQASYVAGEATFLNVLEAERTLIAVRADLLRLRRDSLLAIAELERAIGASLTHEPLEPQS